MLTLEKKQTITDFKKIEEGNYCQLINGEIIMSPAPSTKHQQVIAEIFSVIYQHVKNKNLGKTFIAPTDVYFDAENVFEPDILFVSKERSAIIKDDGIHGAPDLIIEILSPSNSYNDTKTKKKIYEKYGVKEYWIVDPFDGEVIGFANENNVLKEFFRGDGVFTIKLLDLSVKFEF